MNQKPPPNPSSFHLERKEEIKRTRISTPHTHTAHSRTPPRHTPNPDPSHEKRKAFVIFVILVGGVHLMDYIVIKAKLLFSLSQYGETPTKRGKDFGSIKVTGLTVVVVCHLSSVVCCVSQVWTPNEGMVQRIGKGKDGEGWKKNHMRRGKSPFYIVARGKGYLPLLPKLMDWRFPLPEFIFVKG